MNTLVPSSALPISIAMATQTKAALVTSSDKPGCRMSSVTKGSHLNRLYMEMWAVSVAIWMIDVQFTPLKRYNSIWREGQ